MKIDNTIEASVPADEAGHAVPQDDPLLACLEFVARDFGKPFSGRAAVRGLPLRNGRLTPDLVARAAARVGMLARLVQRKVSRVPALVMPFVVLFDGGDACVITAKNKRGTRFSAVFPSVSDKPRRVSLKELERDSSGYLFYLTDDGQGEQAQRTRTRGAKSGHWFWSAVRRLAPSWAQIVVAALVVNMLGLAVPIFVMNVYDRVIPNLAIATLWVLVTGVAGALFFDFLLKLLRAVVLDQTGRRVDMQVAATLFEHALAISMAERNQSAGEVANKIREFETVRDFFTSSSIIAVTDLLFIGVFLYVLWFIVGPIALVPLLAVPVVLIATILFQIPLARAVGQTQSQATRRHSILVESLIGVEAIKAVAGEGVMQRRWENAVAATAMANSSSRFWTSLAIYFTAWVQQAVAVFIIVWGVFLVSDGTITVGALIAANILAGRVLAPLGSIAHTLTRAQQSFGALRELSDFMKLKRDSDDGLTDGRSVERGDVAFKQVSFRYPGGATDVLHDVSFRIGAGEKVGIVGRIGSGKTTIGRLIAGFYPTEDGSVLVGGADVRSYDAADLRADVGYLGQDPELFTGTLRDNLTLGKPRASDEEISEVVRLAGIDSFAADHPLGLGMPIGERGKGLSGGQRQAVVLARLLLRRPKILFLDEPSSAMDTTTESALIRNLGAYLGPEMTLIVSTHRSSFLSLVERLVVLEAGRIVADGEKGAVLKALEGQKLKREPNSNK